MITLEAVQHLKPELVRVRRQLHATPELRFEEKATARFVAHYLELRGLQVTQGIGGYGVVGTCKRGSSGRSIALRADMDALPLLEQNRFEHASRYPGRMHACGHDGHTAMLLGAARFLAERGVFDGTVHFIFQPAEEGGAGAKHMIDDGLFELFSIDAIFGLHNWPGLPAGTFGVKSGPIMASSNIFEVEIRGAGSRVAQPHRTVDSVMVAVHIAQSWQTIASNEVDPDARSVLSIEEICAAPDFSANPDSAVLRGSVKAFDRDTLNLIESKMHAIALRVASALGAEIDFRFQRMYPAVENHSAETTLASIVMRSLVGGDRVQVEGIRSTVAEDFAFFLQQKPGCYALLGAGKLKVSESGSTGDQSYQLHSPFFDFNDDILTTGVAYWVSLVQAWLPTASENELAPREGNRTAQAAPETQRGEL